MHERENLTCRDTRGEAHHNTIDARWLLLSTFAQATHGCNQT
jgi:hypothetical protein